MADSDKRHTTKGNDSEIADAARDGEVGRMMPIDPGVGPGGTTARTSHTDVASGGSGATEWGGGVVTTGRAGVVDPDAGDVPPDEIRNDVRDPQRAYGADRGMTEPRD